MNRPYWLDLVYVAAFFVPPALLAAVAAHLLSRWLDLPAWAAVVAYVVLAVVTIALWVLGLVAVARLMAPRSEASEERD